MKIISGGQTGVDRAALDLALKHQMPCGGWCPSGRLDEHGRIPDRYPVTELPNGDFAARTRQNVIDSDATIIFHRRELIGGTELAVQCCLNYKRPHLLIDAATVSADEAARVVVEFLRSHNIDNLNIAGPRQSEWPEGYDYVLKVLEAIFTTRSQTRE